MKKSKKTLKDLFKDLELVENLLSKLETDNLDEELIKLEVELNKLEDLEKEYSNLTEKDIENIEDNLDAEE